MKSIAAILFAFFMVWQPLTAAPQKGNCCGVPAMACANCCCVAKTPAEPKPLAPVPSRPMNQEPITLLLPTLSEILLLDQSASPSILPQAEISTSAGELPLFERDCALLI